MKNLNFVILLSFVVLLACEKDSDTPKPSKTELLTSGSQKSWYIASLTPDGVCASASDDSWIFFGNGTFEYNHGQIQEVPGSSCSDFVNIEGTWTFGNNESTLTVVAVKEKGSTTNDLNMTLMQGTLSSLDKDKMILTGSHNNESYTVEFRKR